MLARLGEAWKLYQSDERLETVAGILIFILTVGPVVYKVWKVRREVRR